MSYRIEVSPSARQEIKRLSGYVRAQAQRLIDGLAQDPRPARAKELRGKPNVYRIWLARRWRIVYRNYDDDTRVRILRVRLKEHIDYNSIEPQQ